MSYREYLYTFLSVYRLGSQAKAADALSMTQPAVSQHLKSLEHYLGKPLFSREGRQSVPTSIAHHIAANISESIDKLDTLLKQSKQDFVAMQGDIYIGGLYGFFAKMIMPSLPKLSAQNIKVYFEENYETLVPKLLNNELDIAQFTTHVTHPQIEIERLFQHQFILVGHEKFLKKINLAQLKKNDISSLENLPWVIYDSSLLFINEYFLTVFNKNFNGRIALAISDLWAMLAAVTSGVGITILPSYFCEDKIKTHKIKLLYETKKAPSHTFYLGWKKGALHDPKIKFVRELFHTACDRKL